MQSTLFSMSSQNMRHLHCAAASASYDEDSASVNASKEDDIND